MTLMRWKQDAAVSCLLMMCRAQVHGSEDTLNTMRDATIKEVYLPGSNSPLAKQPLEVLGWKTVSKTRSAGRNRCETRTAVASAAG